MGCYEATLCQIGVVCIRGLGLTISKYVSDGIDKLSSNHHIKHTPFHSQCCFVTVKGVRKMHVRPEWLSVHRHRFWFQMQSASQIHYNIITIISSVAVVHVDMTCMDIGGWLLFGDG